MTEAPQQDATERAPSPYEPKAHGSAAVPGAVRTAAAWSWRAITIAAAVIGLIYLIALFKIVVVPVAIALLFTVLLTPVVRFLTEKVRIPRAISSVVAVLGLVAFVVALVTLAGRSIYQGFADLRQQAVEGFEQALEWLAQSPLEIDANRFTEYLQELGNAAEENAGVLLSGAMSLTTTVGQVLAGSIIALFCTFFFLLDGRRIWGWVVGLAPRDRREIVHQAGRRGVVTLAAYTRTQILVAFVDATGIGVGAAILGLPWAFPLGVLVFVGSFIPFVGAIVTGAIAVLVALVTQGWVAALIMLGIVLLVQQIEGNVLQPFLMGHAVSLHPVAVLLVVTAGTMFAGILGALFAVPIAAVLNTVILFFHGHDKFPDLGYDDHVPVRGPGTDVGGRVRAALRRADDRIADDTLEGPSPEATEAAGTER